MSRRHTLALASAAALALTAVPAAADQLTYADPARDGCSYLPAGTSADGSPTWSLSECGVDIPEIDARELRLDFRENGAFVIDVRTREAGPFVALLQVADNNRLLTEPGWTRVEVFTNGDDAEVLVTPTAPGLEPCTNARVSVQGSGTLHRIVLPPACLFDSDVLHVAGGLYIYDEPNGTRTIAPRTNDVVIHEDLLGWDDLRYPDPGPDQLISFRLVRTGAGADRPVIIPRDTGPVCDDADTRSFSDVAPGGVHAAAIGCIAGPTWSLAQGFDDGTYRPQDVLTEGQTAALLVRTLRAAGIEVADSSTCGSGPVAAELGALVDAGIADDCDGSRGQQRLEFARWIAEALEVFAEVTVPEAPDAFADDEDRPERFQSAADTLAALSVMAGTERGRFDPFPFVTRGQTASFLTRTLDVLLDR